MQKIPEEEARALVSQPLFCEDIENWNPLKIQPGTAVCGNGILDADGQSVRMYVELSYRSTPRTKITKYVFTLFKRILRGKERVYQLEVTQTPKRVKDLHKLSHEHMGDLRTDGGATWDNWGYDEVLAHFCAATNITFVPKPAHPDDFQLRGN